MAIKPPRPPSPPLTALRAFEAAARLGGFTRAADELCDGKLMVNHEGGYSDFYVPLCGVAVIEELSGLSTPVRDPYAGTAHVPNQDLMPHQQTFIDTARDGPLELLKSKC